ncbi:MAG: DnaJ domain-containing protein [Xenococcaceae cyanobacterium MO_188.B19]|nr:DnaJ domain-containing protein [Xenococcaceae cyanobacterium MO_188.B19]
MAFDIKHGLFKLNITDHHAILGVAIDADPKQIRLKYLKTAHKLHPDTCRNPDAAGKKLASKLLSRMINPAYEQLSRKTSYLEHQLVLTQIGKRLAENSDRINLSTEFAKQLLDSGDKFELLYPKLLKSLAQEQYKSLESATDKIALISELNLAYLMLQHRKGINRGDSITQAQPSAAKSQTQAPASASSTSQTKPVKKPQATPNPTNSEPPDPKVRVASYIRRAKKYMEQKNLVRAIAELKDGLKIDPNNSTVHALLSKIYLRQQQLTMAKIHLKKAEQANSKDPLVGESKKELDKMLKQKERDNARKGKSSGRKSSKTSGNKPGNSGFLGGLFGSKNK